MRCGAEAEGETAVVVGVERRIVGVSGTGGALCAVGWTPRGGEQGRRGAWCHGAHVAHFVVKGKKGCE